VEITSELLVAGCADEAEDGGILIRQSLEPLGGPGVPVRPASYAGAKYQKDRRWSHEGEVPRPVDVVVIDNVPSQANRAEAQLERLAPSLGLPMLVLDLSGSVLPPHLPSRLSGFRFPHRHADAYLRDSTLDGVAFLKTEVGKEILAATADDPRALLQWFPQSLLYGYWQSHMGKKGTQAKLARSWVSEITGWEPATTESSTLGLKGDALNLSVDDRVAYDEDDPTGWTLVAGDKKAAGKDKKKQDALSSLGHGQVPVESSLAGLSFRSINQVASVSFAALRRVDFGDPEANAAGRAVLVALALVGHTASAGRSFSLRSGCELRPVASSWTWLGADGDAPADGLSPADTQRLFGEVVAVAEAAGLPVGSAWSTEPLVLSPSPSLASVIAATYPIGE